MTRRLAVALFAALLCASCVDTTHPESTASLSPSTTPAAEATASASPSPVALAHIDMCAVPTGLPRSAGPRSGERYASVQGNTVWLDRADSLLTVLDGAPVGAPDRRAVAFWARDLSSLSTRPILTVLDLLTGVRQTFATQDDDRDGPIAWSCDGNALVITARRDDPPATGGGIFFPGPPIYTAIRLLDLRTGLERELARFLREEAVGLTWNPQLRLAAGVVRNPSTTREITSYVAIHDDGTIGRWVLPSDLAWGEIIVDASGSRAFAVGGAITTTSASALLRWAADDGSHSVLTPAPTGRSIAMARAIAGSSDLAVVVRDRTLAPEQRVELWPQDPQSAPRMLVGPLIGQDTVGLIGRVDGSTFVTRSSFQTGLIDIQRIDPTGHVEIAFASTMVPEPGQSLVIGDRAVATLRPAALRATLSRAAAIDSVATLGDKVKRVDRADAKLIEWSDIFRVDGKVTRSSARADQRVWVVAIGGRIEAVTGTGRIPLRWGVWYLDADTGAILDFTTDGRETYVWPSWWDGLIDRGPDQPTRTLPAPARGRPLDFFPQSPCGFATDTIREGGQLAWLLDCTPELDREARRTIGPMLERELWTPCGSGLASASWRRREVITTVVEGSGIAPNYIRIVQRPRAPGEC